MEWISFKKKKPKNGQKILMYFREYMGCDDFIIAQFYIKENPSKPTHWMPIPEPPK